MRDIIKGDFVIILPQSDISLSYKEGKPPRRALKEVWVVDDILEEGVYNISTLDYPSPGSFCSFISREYLRKVR